MIIGTKFNIGDKVWYANPLKDLFELTVYGIVAEVIDNKVLFDYRVGFDEHDTVLRKEEFLFPTKEELLKSL